MKLKKLMRKVYGDWVLFDDNAGKCFTNTLSPDGVDIDNFLYAYSYEKARVKEVQAVDGKIVITI